MNILFVNTYCGKFGGVEQNIADVVDALRERGHHCTLVYSKETEKGADAYRKRFGRAVKSRGGRDLTTTLQAELQRTATDAVYVHKLDSVAPLAPLQGDVRLVRMIHDHDECCPRHHKYFTLSERICTKPVGWRCWADLAFLERDPTRRLGIRFRGLRQHKHELELNRDLFDQFLVGSRFMREELIMNGFPPDRIRCLAPCVRLPNSVPTPVPDTRELLFVGQLIKGKGVDLLLDAVSHLDVPYHLSIAGDGNARTALEQRTQALGLQNTVTFTGWVPRDKLDALYDQCRILAVPSRWAEPFGMIGLEAMQRARPVVGFAVGGIPDWLENGVNGLAIPERDTAQFADALKTLLRDINLARTMGQQGRRKLETAFSFSYYADTLIETLQPEKRATL